MTDSVNRPTSASFDASWPFAIARSRVDRWVIIASVVGFAIAFTAAAFLSTPIYRATVVLAPANNHSTFAALDASSSPLSGLASLAGINLGAKNSGMQEALAVLQSREFGELFIKNDALMPQIYANEWDTAQGRWKVPAVRAPTIGEAFRYFDKHIRHVEQDQKTGLIILHVQWRNRRLAAQWANDMVNQINAEMRARAIRRSSTFLKYLENAYDSTSVIPTRDAVATLIETQVKQKMIASVSKDFAFRVVDRALPPDAGNPIWPPRALLIALGPIVGLAIALVLLAGKAAMGRRIDRLNRE